MSYEKQNFVDGLVLRAEHLNKIEDGICEVEKKIDEIEIPVGTGSVKLKLLEESGFSYQFDGASAFATFVNFTELKENCLYFLGIGNKATGYYYSLGVFSRDQNTKTIELLNKNEEYVLCTFTYEPTNRLDLVSINGDDISDNDICYLYEVVSEGTTDESSAINVPTINYSFSDFVFDGERKYTLTLDNSTGKYDNKTISVYLDETPVNNHESFGTWIIINVVGTRRLINTTINVILDMQDFEGRTNGYFEIKTNYSLFTVSKQSDGTIITTGGEGPSYFETLHNWSYSKCHCYIDKQIGFIMYGDV